MSYTPFEKRYETMKYNRCGRSGLQLPAVSLGLWNNFGGDSVTDNARRMVFRALMIVKLIIPRKSSREKSCKIGENSPAKSLKKGHGT